MKLCPLCQENYDDDQERCLSDDQLLVDLGAVLPRGHVIDNRYTVEKVLGRGAMGIVYMVHQNTTGRTMALKLMGGQSTNVESVKRFLREAKTISSLHHPNIVTLFDFGHTDDDRSYLVTEQVEGKTLQALLAERQQFSLSETISIARQICLAMAEAHKLKIVHRDLKPANIILQSRSQLESSGKWTTADPYLVKVVDFGVAKLLGTEVETSESLTQDGCVCGSPAYMSPEQCKGEDLDARTDIYSLGVTLFEMLTGKRPFTAGDAMGLMYRHVNEKPPSLSSARLDLGFPAKLEEVLFKCLSKNKENRHGTIEELLRDLEEVQANPDAPVPAAEAEKWILLSGSRGDRFARFMEQSPLQSDMTTEMCGVGQQVAAPPAPVSVTQTTQELEAYSDPSKPLMSKRVVYALIISMLLIVLLLLYLRSISH